MDAERNGRSAVKHGTCTHDIENRINAVSWETQVTEATDKQHIALHGDTSWQA
jgi:hypothetical protein